MHSSVGCALRTDSLGKMPNYKRAHESTTYFFTVVTQERQPFLCAEQSRQFLREAINEVRASHPFKIDAWVLLPDHLHCIWTLPEGDTAYSVRWGMIKARFSGSQNNAVREAHPAKSLSRASRRESTYWQRRFWEHAIRDQKDYNAHMDYIHFNPVKHGLVSAPKDWEYSSFHRLVEQGAYDREWGLSAEMDFMDVGSE